MGNTTTTFNVTIQGKDQLLAALQQAPEIAKPIIQQFLEKALAVLAQNTTAGIVPYKTGRLRDSFVATIGDLMGTWKPTVEYAPDVEFGTGPHKIVPVNKQALFWPGANHPVKSVNHPGTKPNPYMERIMAASEPGINALFSQALAIITQDIANRSKT